MAYNPMYPLNYNAQMYPTQMSGTYAPQAGTQMSSPNTGILWVQGEAGAKSYLVAPNTTVQLWDSENPVIYLKSADASGMPSMKILDYTVRGAQTAHTPVVQSEPNYVTHDELQALEERMTKSIDELKEVRREPVKSNASGNAVKK